MALLSILRGVLSKGSHLIGIGLLLAAGSSQGQNFGLAQNCAGCHTNPPTVQANSATANPSDCSGSTYAIGLGESFVGSSDAAKSALKARLRSGCATSYMSDIADKADATPPDTTDLDIVVAYLLKLRDAQSVPASANLSFPTPTAVNSSQKVSTSFTLTNYRATALTLSLGNSNGRFSTGNLTNSCGGTTTSVAAASSSTAPTTCQISFDITFNPLAADVVAPQTSATLMNTVTVNLSYTGSDIAPVAASGRTIAVSAAAYVPTPVFTLSPSNGSTLTMSGRINNATDTRTITIGNAADATASLVNIRPSLTGSSQFTLRTSGAPAPACQSASGPFTLTAGSTCNLTLAFTPLQAGSNGTLTVASDNAASASLTLSGTGTQSIAVAPASLDFGEVKKDAFKDLVLTVANSNTATAPLNLTGAPQKQGTAAGDYTVTANTCNSAVSQGGTCTLTLRFSPATSDGSARPATLTLPTDAAIPGGGLVTVGLTGKGTAQSAPTLSAPSLAFADTVIGETSPAMTVTLTNPRTGALTYALSLPADFIEDTPTCAGRVVAANGGTCVVSLRLRPLAAAGAGNRSGNAIVTFTVPAGQVPVGQTPPANLTLALSGNALMPVAASPTLLAPSATFGTSTLASATVVNRSASAVTLGGVTFSGDAAGDYTLDATSVCRSGVTLGARLSCSLVLRYAPSQTGPRNATLEIAHNAVAGSPLTLTLSGTVAIGQLSLGASSVGFADTALGSSASATPLTLRNTGSAPLTLTALALGGSQPGDFTRAGTCQVGGALAIGAECTVTLQFQPAALGARSATLSITHTGSAPSPVVLTLTGNGIAQPVGVLSIDGTNPLDFGTQTLNGLYSPRAVHLRNTGTASLQLVGVAVTGNGFSLIDNAACTGGTTLAIGQACDLAVRFTPSGLSNFSATLTVTHSATGSPQTLGLTGHGTAAVVPVVTWVGSTDARDFGQQVVGGAAAPAQTISLLNQGPGAIQFSLINTIGLDAAMFPVQGGATDACSTTTPLDQGKTCTITLSFSPGTPGSHAARLQVISSGTALPLMTLTGTGLGPASGTTLGVAPVRLDFGAVRVGAASAPMEVVLRADSQGAIRVGGWAIEGAFSVESRTCPAAPFTLTAGDQCTLLVSFRPGTTGDAAGALQITASSGADLPATVQRVPLGGQGQPAADVVGQGDGGGGCSIVRDRRDGRIDPTLLVLAALAVLILWYRRRHPGPSRHDR